MKTMKLLLCLLALIPFVGAVADNTDDLKKEINKIKKSNQYIYGEATDSTEEAAHELAEEILTAEINKWKETKKKLQNSANIVVTNKKSLRTTLALRRGNMYRAFVYVKKSDIIAVENSITIADNGDASKQKDLVSSVTSIIPDVVVSLSQCTEYSDLASKIQLYQADGKIKNYARYASLENPKVCYLAIYDKVGKVRAILTPGEERRNVATGAADSETNYSGCGAIGFEVNE